MKTFNRQVIIIPESKTAKRVGIYCRVSSAKKEQLHSLATQLSGLTIVVFENHDWRLADTYIDVKPGSSVAARPGLQRLLMDCHDVNIDIVATTAIVSVHV